MRELPSKPSRTLSETLSMMGLHESMSDAEILDGARKWADEKYGKAHDYRGPKKNPSMTPNAIALRESRRRRLEAQRQALTEA